MIYDRPDGLMTGVGVYRLEELVQTEQPLLPDQLQTATEGRADPESAPEGSLSPSVSYAATWTGCCDWLRGSRAQPVKGVFFK